MKSICSAAFRTTQQKWQIFTLTKCTEFESALDNFCFLAKLNMTYFVCRRNVFMHEIANNELTVFTTDELHRSKHWSWSVSTFWANLDWKSWHEDFFNLCADLPGQELQIALGLASFWAFSSSWKIEKSAALGNYFIWERMWSVWFWKKKFQWYH